MGNALILNMSFFFFAVKQTKNQDRFNTKWRLKEREEEQKNAWNFYAAVQLSAQCYNVFNGKKMADGYTHRIAMQPSEFLKFFLVCGLSVTNVHRNVWLLYQKEMRLHCMEIQISHCWRSWLYVWRGLCLSVCQPIFVSVRVCLLFSARHSWSGPIWSV